MVKLTMLLKRLWSWISGSKVVQYAAILILAFTAGKRSAQQQQRANQLKTEIKEIQTAMEQKDEAEQKSNNLDDATIDQRMRKSGWLRD